MLYLRQKAAILNALEKFLTVSSKGLEELVKEAILIWNLKALSAIPEKKINILQCLHMFVSLLQSFFELFQMQRLSRCPWWLKKKKKWNKTLH